MAEILGLKNSGLALCRLDCGCEVRLRHDHLGRIVKPCGANGQHDGDKAGNALGYFVQQARRLLKEINHEQARRDRR